MSMAQQSDFIKMVVRKDLYDVCGEGIMSFCAVKSVTVSIAQQPVFVEKIVKEDQPVYVDKIVKEEVEVPVDKVVRHEVAVHVDKVVINETPVYVDRVVPNEVSAICV